MQISQKVIFCSIACSYEGKFEEESLNLSADEEHFNVAKEKVVKSKPLAKTDVPKQILNLPTQRKETATDDNDDDTNFLLSFRGDMREMNRSQKMDFKIGMLQLVRNIQESNL